MGSISLGYSTSLVIFLFSILVLVSSAEVERKLSAQNKNNTISAIYVFGDSSVDSGNNNYVDGTGAKFNFTPYGKDFPGHKATGRVSNGRLTTDFIASYIGVKENVPPYLDPTLSMEDLMSGVDFASSSSGFDPFTAETADVLDMTRQLQYFREYKTKLESKIGKERTENHIKSAVFVISAGTNDFALSFYRGPPEKRKQGIAGYENTISGYVNQFIQDLLKEAAKKIAVIGIPPLGGSVFIRKTEPKDVIQRYNATSLQYNVILRNLLSSIEKSPEAEALGAKLYYIDYYTPFEDMLLNKQKYGFEEVDNACCSTNEYPFACNMSSIVCSDASKYMFWDAVHPTEKTYYNVFKFNQHIFDVVLKD